MKARIVKTRVGVIDFYYPQIQETVLFIFKIWSSVGHVSLNSGRTSWYRDLGSCREAAKTLRDYETLYGIRLDQTGDYNWQLEDIYEK